MAAELGHVESGYFQHGVRQEGDPACITMWMLTAPCRGPLVLPPPSQCLPGDSVQAAAGLRTDSQFRTLTPQRLGLCRDSQRGGPHMGLDYFGGCGGVCGV